MLNLRLWAMSRGRCLAENPKKWGNSGGEGEPEGRCDRNTNLSVSYLGLGFPEQVLRGVLPG